MAEFILKDWYGKDCKFDHDKIFVQDVNGELVQFTQGKGESVLESLEVTENGTYTPNEGVDGFNSVNVNVPTPEITLQDKTITENGTFTADEGFDGLGSVVVAVAGSGGEPKLTNGYSVQVSGAYGERINFNFGYKPDFILLTPSSSVTPTKNTYITTWGISSKLANAVGRQAFSNQLYYSSAGQVSTGSICSRGIDLDKQEGDHYISNTDETGFTLNQKMTAGKYSLFAMCL